MNPTSIAHGHTTRQRPHLGLIKQFTLCSARSRPSPAASYVGPAAAHHPTQGRVALFPHTRHRASHTFPPAGSAWSGVNGDPVVTHHASPTSASPGAAATPAALNDTALADLHATLARMASAKGSSAPTATTFDLQGRQLTLDSPIEVSGASATLTITNGTLLLPSIHGGTLRATHGGTLQLLCMQLVLFYTPSMQSPDSTKAAGARRRPHPVVLASADSCVVLEDCSVDGRCAPARLLCASGPDARLEARRCKLQGGSTACLAQHGAALELEMCGLGGYRGEGILVDGAGSQAHLLGCRLTGNSRRSPGSGTDGSSSSRTSNSMFTGYLAEGDSTPFGLQLEDGGRVTATGCFLEGHCPDVYCEGGSEATLRGCVLDSGRTPDPYVFDAAISCMGRGSAVVLEDCQLQGGVEVHGRGAAIELVRCSVGGAAAAPGGPGVEGRTAGGRISVQPGGSTGSGDALGGGVWVLGDAAGGGGSYGSGAGHSCIGDGDGVDGGCADADELLLLEVQAGFVRGGNGPQREPQHASRQRLPLQGSVA